MRRTAIILVVIAAGALLGACGKSAHFGSAHAASAKQQSKASGHAPAPLTEVAAKKLAVALNLQHGDLPAFKVSSSGRQHETPAEKARERKLIRCVGGHAAAGALAEASSKTFERQASVVHVGVGSSVTIVHTSTQASQGLDAMRSQRTQVCLTQFVDQLIAGEKTHGGGSFKLGSVSKATPSARGTSGTFAWRIAGVYTLNSLHIPFYMDLVGFAYEQDEVQLLAYGIPVPFPPVGVQTLFSLLVERAKAGGHLAPRGKGARPSVPDESGPQQVQI